MIIDYFLSKDGLRVDRVDLSLHGMRLARGASGFVPQLADRVTGTIRLTLADLSAALARPEIIDQLLLGIPGIARPEFGLVNGEDGGLRLVGSVEALGRRIPLAASTRVHVVNDKLVMSTIRLEGLPLLGVLAMPTLDLQLPLNLPLGLTFTDVTTEPGCVVLAFEGTDVELARPKPTVEPERGDRR